MEGKRKAGPTMLLVWASAAMRARTRSREAPSIAVGHVAEVADFPKALRQDVEQELPDEVIVGQRQEFPGTAGGPVDPREGHLIRR